MPGGTTVYDGGQRCTATDEAKGKSVAMSCPYTGKGAELSPGNLLEAALAGCRLISTGTPAARDGIDLKGASTTVEMTGSPIPASR